MSEKRQGGNMIERAPTSTQAIRSVEMPPRGPVTRQMVRELAQDENLRGLARIALKYAQKQK
jgi:hypothetical protein